MSNGANRERSAARTCGKAASVFEPFADQAFPHLDHAVTEQEREDRHEAALYEYFQHVMANQIQRGWLEEMQLVFAEHAVLKNKHIGHQDTEQAQAANRIHGRGTFI